MMVSDTRVCWRNTVARKVRSPIASADLAEQVRARLRGTYTSTFVGLRPGFTLVVFKRQP